MSLSITKEELFSQYLIELNTSEPTEINRILSGEENCKIIYKLVCKNGVKVPINPKILYGKYMNRIFHISDEDWKNNYGRKEICDIIYDIIDETISS